MRKPSVVSSCEIKSFWFLEHLDCIFVTICFIISLTSLCLCSGTVIIQTETCPVPVTSTKCQCRSLPDDGVSLECRNLNRISFLSVDAYKSVRSINIIDSNLEYLKLTDFAPFHGLQNLSVVNSSVRFLKDDFPKAFDQLQFLNLSWNMLESIRPRSMKNLISLKQLDLCHNNLKYLDIHVVEPLASLTDLDLSDNPWDCNNSLSWLSEWQSLEDDEHKQQRRLLNPEQTICSESFAGKQLIAVMGVLQKMNEACPDRGPHNCTCEIKKPLLAVISVNCSGRNMDSFPLYLPENTRTLDMSNNQISHLRPLVDNIHYRSVVNLYLDNNIIESVNSLEGSDWIYNFRMLSLTGNKITQLPTYALENAFKKNLDVVHLCLGNNPWRCDCNTTPTFLTWLTKYQGLIKDINDIRCGGSTDDINFNKQIKELQHSDMCQEETDYSNYLDLLNGILATLIVLLVAKLLYDYWSYKKTGKLPWIVSKIP